MDYLLEYLLYDLINDNEADAVEAEQIGCSHNDSHAILQINEIPPNSSPHIPLTTQDTSPKTLMKSR